MKKNVYTSVMNARAQAKAPTPQTKVIPGREKDMARNNAGGVSFVVDAWTQLDRFLVLGTESGSYYAGAHKMTKDNAKNVLACLKLDGARTVARIVEISDAGRAPKNDPALFALALALTHGDDETKALAAVAIPAVARIGTHLFHLAEMVNGMRGWGRGLRRGFAAWYNDKTPMALAHQMVKYANRDGWTHRDVLRLAHVKAVSPTHDALFTNAVGKSKAVEIDSDVADFMSAVEEIKTLTGNPKKAVQLITDFKLPREVLPTELLNEAKVWGALLPHMGITALVRNLATMTRAGVIGGPQSEGTKLVVAKMGDEEVVKKSRIHPLQVLVALNTYGAGKGIRGSNVWNADKKVLDALEAMFYLSFKNVVPTGKATLLALDCSASMTWNEIAGMPGITPRIGSAAMAMVTARTESDYEFIAFSTALSRLKITDKSTLAEAIREIERQSPMGTDCALPMLWADKNKLKFENFVVYTDNETWAGQVHPSQALQQYRGNSGLAARLAVVGMTATPFTIADPKDAGMMDVVGFDTAAPAIMSDFFRGEL